MDLFGTALLECGIVIRRGGGGEVAPEFCSSKVRLPFAPSPLRAQSIAKEVTKVSEIVGCSKREVQAIVARAEPVVRKPRETIKPVVVKAAETPLFQAKPLPPQEERVEVRFMSREDFEALEELRAELSSKLSKALTMEALVVKLIELQRKPKMRNVKPTSLRAATFRNQLEGSCIESTTGSAVIVRRMEPGVLKGTTSRLIISFPSLLAAQQSLVIFGFFVRHIIN